MKLVIDSCALVAMILDEPEAEVFSKRILAGEAVMAAPSQLETLMVLSRRADGASQLSRLLQGYGITVAPFGGELVPLAYDAFMRFGKGRHPAGLNFGDCISYALARSLRAPLLFKGRDFSLTDIIPAL